MPLNAGRYTCFTLSHHRDVSHLFLLLLRDTDNDSVIINNGEMVTNPDIHEIFNFSIITATSSAKINSAIFFLTLLLLRSRRRLR